MTPEEKDKMIKSIAEQLREPRPNPVTVIQIVFAIVIAFFMIAAIVAWPPILLVAFIIWAISKPLDLWNKWLDK